MAIFLASQHINPSEDFTNPHPTFARPYQSYKSTHKYLPPCEPACAICSERTTIIKEVDHHAGKKPLWANVEAEPHTIIPNINVIS